MSLCSFGDETDNMLLEQERLEKALEKSKHRTIFIYQEDKCTDPMVYTTWKDAIEAVSQEIDYYAEMWGDDDAEVLEARKEFEECLIDRSKDWYGTVILDNVFGFYVREVEFPD